MTAEHPALVDVRGLARLIAELHLALLDHDRDHALDLLNRVRELARHAFALVQHERTPLATWTAAGATSDEPERPVLGAGVGDRPVAERLAALEREIGELEQVHESLLMEQRRREGKR